ncbi:hypothetical protein BCR44DRAFT_49032, partial [Catenaria anguillulae PL171]
MTRSRSRSQQGNAFAPNPLNALPITVDSDSDSDSDSSDIAVLSPSLSPTRSLTNPRRRRLPPKPPTAAAATPPTTNTMTIDMTDLSSDDILHDPAVFPLNIHMPHASHSRPSSSASNPSNASNASNTSTRHANTNPRPTQMFEVNSDSGDDLMYIDTTPHRPATPPSTHTPPPPPPRLSSSSSASSHGPSHTSPPITLLDGDDDDDDIRILPPAGGLDPVAAACGDCLIMFPDIDPSFLKQFVADLSNPGADPAQLAAVAVNSLLERKEGYPKIDKALLRGASVAARGKRKRDSSRSDSDENDEDDLEIGGDGDGGSDDDVIDMSPNAKKRRKVARDRRRGKGPDLRQHQPNLKLTDACRSSCLHVLQSEFPTVPMSYVQTVLARHHGQYVVCHEALQEASAANPPPYKPIRPRRVCPHTRCGMDPLLKEHVEWLVDTKKHDQHVALAAKQAEQELEQAKLSGLALECGCCFDTYLPRDLAS